ncbi:acyltransferase family protein [Acidithiobacillus sp. AMEEHan]|uniref:acyltransferase family protein n=1 Tax=Acidithiobacillus sp. AMEEHan TaxID=2994951 RepID=UPI0027E42304|nr:acyltransferase family protein [Acidithiobacillus sp. AMEEHan]
MLPYIDYLKFLAIFAVIAFHIHDTISFAYPWFSGGYLGVDIFLLLSGFLIEKSLERGRQSTLAQRSKDFFARRFSRILVPMLAVTAILAILLWSTDLLTGWAPVWYSAILGYNFYLVLHHIPYFQVYSYPHPFLGMWFISLLGQLYLLHFLLRTSLPRKWLYRTVLPVLFCVSLGSAWWLMRQGNLNAAYVLPSHAFPYLAGALLTELGWARPREVGRSSFDGLGILALLLLLALFIWAPYENFVYFSLAATALGLVFLLAAARAAWLPRLRLLVLGKLGEMSYSLYLLNVPVVALVHYYFPQTSIASQVLFSLSLLLLLSVLTYLLLELPLQAAFQKQARHGVGRGAFVLVLVLLALASGGWWQANRLGQEAVRQQAQAQHDALYRQYLEKRVASMGRDLQALTGAKTLSAAEAEAHADSRANKALESNADLMQWQPHPGLGFLYNGQELRSNPAYPEKQVLFITDSILLGWSGYVIHMIPNGILDGQVGRSFFRAQAVLQKMFQDPAYAKVAYVVVELGSNGYVQWPDLESFVQAVGDRKILLIVPSVPRPWENEVRSMYDRAAAKYPNITLLHWNRISDGHPSYFVADQVHLNWDGAQALMQAVLRTLYQMGYRNPLPVKAVSVNAAPATQPLRSAKPSAATQSAPVSATASSAVVRDSSAKARSGVGGFSTMIPIAPALQQQRTGQISSPAGETTSEPDDLEESQAREGNREDAGTLQSPSETRSGAPTQQQNMAE